MSAGIVWQTGDEEIGVPLSAAVVATDASGRRVDAVVSRRPPTHGGPETFTRPPKPVVPTRPRKPPGAPDRKS